MRLPLAALLCVALTATLAPSADARSGVSVAPTLPAAELSGMRHVHQTLNNCGPASVVMALSTLGVQASQEEARLALRGTDLRRGMGPGPVNGWVDATFGLRSIWRNNGSPELMKALVSNGFAPMVTQWLYDPEIRRVSHWRVVRGYDDAQGVYYVNDPILGERVALGYDWFERNWQPFSYRWMVVYDPQDEPLLRAILGRDWSETLMRQDFHERMREEARVQGTSSAWLAYGEAAYRNGRFGEAVAAFEKGLALGSAEGVFTLRSSYPQALRALGRGAEADAAARRLSRTATSNAVAAAPEPFALALALRWVQAQRVTFSE